MLYTDSHKLKTNMHTPCTSVNWDVPDCLAVGRFLLFLSTISTVFSFATSSDRSLEEKTWKLSVKMSKFKVVSGNAGCNRVTKKRKTPGKWD